MGRISDPEQIELAGALLFPALRFASRGAGNLRGLGALFASVAKRLGAAGIDPATLAPAIRAAEAFDAAAPDARQTALEVVMERLGEVLPLPPDLGKAAAPRPGGGPRPPAAGRTRPPAPEELVLTSPGAPPAEPARPRATRAPMKATPSGGRATGRSAGRAAPPPAEAAPGPARIAIPTYAKDLCALPLSSLAGVGPRLEEAFARKGIASVGHLLFHLPRTYQDRRDVSPVARLEPGTRGLACVEVLDHREIFIRKTRRKMFRVSVGDASGKMALTFFRTWPGLAKRFAVGKRFFVWGEVKAFGGTKQIAHPEVEEVEEGEEGTSLSAGRIVPVYRGMEELGQGRVRDLVEQALERHAASLPEILPEALVRERSLPSAAEALRRIHFPPASADIGALLEGASPWHRRMAYEELFLLSAGLALKARGIQVEPGHAFDVSRERIDRALSMLPFTPTDAQRRAIEAIAGDMARPEPMNRLLQGDVGSGKTAVALVACLLAVFDGRQAALLAPTEILAEQHHRSFSSLLEGSGHEVALLVAGRGARAVNEARERIASGAAQIAIGTHALLSSTSVFDSLGLVVIDEQHRFGVEQRAELIGKGRRPDVLVMTATPIPRTLSLVLHGELTQTVIDELPPGRTPVRTRVVPARERERAYRVLEEELEKGRQAYVVHPLIEESEHSDLEDATQGLRRLRERLPGRRLALLHGRMKADERDEVMASFRAGAIDVLVSTTVVEVGVDVPNATVMVVENAERFGLSQLHQLRGRVGRGAASSVCLLIDHGGGEGKAGARLRTMERTTDGFAIARADLEIRGPGEFLGTRQAGLPELAHADLARDARLLEQARSDAFTLVAQDPDLGAPAHRLLRAEVWERFAERMSLARVG